MKDLGQFINLISKTKSIALISHVSPDGDTLGSMAALALGLKTLKIETIDMFVTDKVPEIYSFLPLINKVKNINEAKQNYDIAIALDCGAKDRFLPAIAIFENAKTTVNIDHHITNSNYADINLVKTQLSATGEVVFEIFKKINIEITCDIAINLYSAILTDTGGFKFNNTKPSTFECVSKLVKTGIDHCKIHENCYENRPLELIKLHAHCIDKAEFIKNNKIAYTFVTKQTLQEIGALDEHTEGLSERLRQVNTVEVAFVLKEIDKNKTKISFRSKNVDVSKICKIFGGGGHKLAAGCKINKAPKDALNEILPIVIQEVNNEKSV